MGLGPSFAMVSGDEPMMMTARTTEPAMASDNAACRCGDNRRRGLDRVVAGNNAARRGGGGGGSELT